jgi:sterol desaturase/sphingolipid hydroxylase (fatty acid hydroxylase superfamily)
MIGARHHRAHHRDPWDLRFVVMPVPTALSIGTAIAVAAWLVCPSFSLFLTTMTLTAGTAFYYEWVHFLSHTSYRPRGAWFKRQWRLHRLHHFKNEGYWFGVTRHFGDTVFGTFPEAEAVPTSKTARTLGVAD